MKKVLLIICVFLIIILTLVSMNLDSTYTSCNISLEKFRKTLPDGQNVKIAIIDSGVTSKFKNNESVLNFSGEDSTTDYINHGEPIYKIISKLAPNASIYSLKVINKYGNASSSDIYDALEWCLNNSIDIINVSMSFGLQNENVECIIEQLIDNGVIIVSSISNHKKALDFPSMCEGVICVGKTDVPEQYDYSNSIIVQKQYFINNIENVGKDLELTGNSFMAPLVTGTIACVFDKNYGERRRTNEDYVDFVKAVFKKNAIHIT